ncbi:MAG: carbamoyl-phosphate synthase (glutamine-hydrolyzing) large subunit [Patescibacteria group bacterium]
MQNTLSKKTLPKKVFIIGSGGLKIGQAGEFDYSGSQAIKALKEEGIKTVLLNPNIATVQTDADFADRVYFLPLTLHFAARIIAREHPDAILLNVGGQSALNLGLELDREGVLKRHRVRVLGTSLKTIHDTEDRAAFSARLQKIGIAVPRGTTVKNMEEGLLFAKRIAYPVMVRVGFSLGGLGSGYARNPRELRELLNTALSQGGEALLEEYLGGWKEIEYEIMRDSFGNAVTVCNMENMDPMGIHTGESIVVAPSQTLSNKEYHLLRAMALKVAHHLDIVGECNIQFAVEPKPRVKSRVMPRIRVIEVNARLSRSSALASKATGYPLAFVATKAALGIPLHAIPNAITRATGSFFEPALDYIAVKIPRWDLTKFRAAELTIGSEMKSVGEVMALGRSFPEALQKAVRMLCLGKELFMNNGYHDLEKALRDIRIPTPSRLFAFTFALGHKVNVSRIARLSGIDPWFLSHLKTLAGAYASLRAKGWDEVRRNTPALKKLKQLGFSDACIAEACAHTEHAVRRLRKQCGVVPTVKQIDTTAGEFPAKTNYLYCTYHGSAHDVTRERRPAIVLGSGPYRIGSSVEFDWCCVNTAKTLRHKKIRTIVVNSNPETVSTDYDMSDRLYFEELTLERILDICEFERPRGLVVSMGGQVPNNLALSLAHAKVPLWGTSARNIDRAEDRHKFSALLDRLNIDQPAWKELTTVREACAFANAAGFPVLVRPSYVLSGSAMNVAEDEEELTRYLTAASAVTPDHPVVVSKFIEGAKEVEIDGVAQKGELVLYAVTEHVEHAGVHSGDATVVYPPQRLFLETTRRVKLVCRNIVKELDITGPFNIQFLVKDNRIQVIECNLRASRSFPFVSKVSRYNFIDFATRAMLGEDIRGDYRTLDLDYVAVKAPKYSFSRIKGADPKPTVEMASTGEVACFGDSYEEAFLKAIAAAGNYYPKKTILLSIGPDTAKGILLFDIQALSRQGFVFAATEHTANFLEDNGIETLCLRKVSEGGSPNVSEWIRGRKVDCVINIPERRQTSSSRTDGFFIRRLAVDSHIPLHTDLKIAKMYLRSLSTTKEDDLSAKAWDEYTTAERWWKG